MSNFATVLYRIHRRNKLQCRREKREEEEGTNVHPSCHRESWIRKGGEVRARNSRGRQETESARARVSVCMRIYTARCAECIFNTVILGG